MASTFKEQYCTPDNKVYWQTVLSNDSDGDTSFIDIARINIIKQRILQFYQDNNFSRITNSLKSQVNWLKCLMHTFKDLIYAHERQNETGVHWILEYSPSYILILNWTIIIFNLKDCCEKTGNHLLKVVLGKEFIDIFEQITGGRDFKQWSSKHRNVIAHGGNVSVSIVQTSNFKLKFMNKKHIIFEENYLYMFNCLRRIAHLIFVLFNQ